MPTIQAPGYRSINYDEVTPGSPTISMGKGQHQIERIFRINWTDIDDFSKAVLGFPYVVDMSGFNDAPYDSSLRRVLPMSLGSFTIPYASTTDGGTRPWLFASRITRIEGSGSRGYVDGASQFPVHQWAKVTVLFESQIYHFLSDQDMANIGGTYTPPYGVTGPGTPGSPIIDEYTKMRRYITKTRRPSADYVTIPRQAMRWVPEAPARYQFADGPTGDQAYVNAITIFNQETQPGGAVPVDYATAMLIPSMELQYVWHEVPFIPAAARKFVGYVNWATVDDGSGTGTAPGADSGIYGPETLLLLSADIKPYRHGSGKFVYDITYRMKQFEPSPGRGHNYFLRWLGSSKKLNRRRLTDDGIINVDNTITGRAVYPSVDFTYLFSKNYPANWQTLRAATPFRQPSPDTY
jgi:hypothetical protein